MGAVIGKSICIFAGGGTGGHLYPGLAVAEELTRLDSDVRVVFACSDRPIDRRILGQTPYALVPQPVQPLPRRPAELEGFLRAWRRSAALADELIGDLRPKAVLGLGGFAAAPVLRKARRVAATALLNPDAVPGKANRYLAGKVGAIFTQFDGTVAQFAPGLRGKVQCVGCPVRLVVATGDRAAAIEAMGLRTDRQTVLILGGSSGAAGINRAVADLARRLSRFADSWQFLHVAGLGRQAQMQGPSGGAIAVRMLEYCHRMDMAYAAADLALCRGGASTVAELTATGTPAVIVPYPYHRDRQQFHNAAALVKAGAAVCVEEAPETEADVTALVAEMEPLMAHQSQLTDMAGRAASLAKPDAAAAVARWLAEAI